MADSTRSGFLSRRNFLAHTALLGAALPVASMVWAASDQSNATKTSSRTGGGTMKTRKLGTMEVSEMGAGCMSISANYGPPADINQGIAVIRAAHDNGVTFFDTAEVYGPYTSEELVGQALAPIRDQVKIATKFGFAIDGTIGLNSRPERIKQVAEASLKRLKTDRIDLFYQHRVDQNVPIEDVAGAVSRADPAGEGPPLRALRGECRDHPPRACCSAGDGSPDRSLMERDPERNGVLAACEELEIGFVSWGPVGMGFLTGKMDAGARPENGPPLRLRALQP
jgi:aryl-alcohol dehydrogenase-like predicted oxidoreductase